MNISGYYSLLVPLGRTVPEQKSYCGIPQDKSDNIMSFRFNACNNVAEYKALITVLDLALKLGVKNVSLHLLLTSHKTSHGRIQGQGSHTPTISPNGDLFNGKTVDG
ncbi:hypothetical protein V6N13_001455 [Hibiscus sabdariffa]|uniref:Uncharacterized protein n=1 Tax=Hibiscus sabdariffa TaxID=183260 RepID=A0ABR2G8E5_9ROSI